MCLSLQEDQPIGTVPNTNPKGHDKLSKSAIVMTRNSYPGQESDLLRIPSYQKKLGPPPGVSSFEAEKKTGAI